MNKFAIIRIYKHVYKKVSDLLCYLSERKIGYFIIRRLQDYVFRVQADDSVWS